MDIDALKISFFGHKDEAVLAENCFAAELKEGRLLICRSDQWRLGKPQHKVYTSEKPLSDVAIIDHISNTKRRECHRVWEEGGMRKRVTKLFERNIARMVIVIFQENYGRLAVYIVKKGDSTELHRSVPGARFYDPQGKEVPAIIALESTTSKMVKYTEVRDYKVLLRNI